MSAGTYSRFGMHGSFIPQPKHLCLALAPGKASAEVDSICEPQFKTISTIPSHILVFFLIPLPVNMSPLQVSSSGTGGGTLMQSSNNNAASSTCRTNAQLQCNASPEPAFEPVEVDKHKKQLFFWLGLERPLESWPDVSSENHLDTNTIKSLIDAMFPGSRPIIVELLNIHNFVASCRDLNSGTWKRSLSAAQVLKLNNLVYLVNSTQFREFFRGNLLSSLASHWLPEVYAPSLCSGQEPPPSSKKRCHQGQLKQPNKLLNHFCIGTPPGFSISGIRFPLLPKTVRSKACLTTYMSRLFEPPQSHLDSIRDDMGNDIVFIRVHDPCLVRPCRRQQLLDLIQRHGQNRTSRESRSSHSSVSEAPYGLFPMDDNVRQDVLSCLRIWHVDDQGNPLDDTNLQRLAFLLAHCALSSDVELGIRSLKSLSRCLSTLLEQNSLVSNKDLIYDQHNQGLTRLSRLLVRDRTGEHRAIWQGIAEDLATIFAGDHAQLMLIFLIRKIEQTASSLHLDAVIASWDDNNPDLSPYYRSETVSLLMEAFQLCHSRYDPVLQGKMLRSDQLNSNLLRKLARVRLGFDCCAVNKNSKSGPPSTRSKLKAVLNATTPIAMDTAASPGACSRSAEPADPSSSMEEVPINPHDFFLDSRGAAGRSGTFDSLGVARGASNAANCLGQDVLDPVDRAAVDPCPAIIRARGSFRWPILDYNLGYDSPCSDDYSSSPSPSTSPFQSSPNAVLGNDRSGPGSPDLLFISPSTGCNRFSGTSSARASTPFLRPFGYTGENDSQLCAVLRGSDPINPCLLSSSLTTKRRSSDSLQEDAEVHLDEVQFPLQRVRESAHQQPLFTQEAGIARLGSVAAVDDDMEVEMMLCDSSHTPFYVRRPPIPNSAVTLDSLQDSVRVERSVTDGILATDPQIVVNADDANDEDQQSRLVLSPLIRPSEAFLLLPRAQQLDIDATQSRGQLSLRPRLHTLQYFLRTLGIQQVWTLCHLQFSARFRSLMHLRNKVVSCMPTFIAAAVIALCSTRSRLIAGKGRHVAEGDSDWRALCMKESISIKAFSSPEIAESVCRMGHALVSGKHV